MLLNNHLLILVIFSLISDALSKCDNCYDFLHDEGYLDSCDFNTSNTTSLKDVCFWFADGGDTDWKLVQSGDQVQSGFCWSIKASKNDVISSLNKRVRGGERAISSFRYKLSGKSSVLSVKVSPLDNSINCSIDIFHVSSTNDGWMSSPDIRVGLHDNYMIKIEAKLSNGGFALVDDVDFAAEHPLESVEPAPDSDGICLNGGHYISTTNHAADFACCCPSGFTGKYCHINIDECSTGASSRCLNNATCLDMVDGYTCLCQAGFTGIDCSVEIDECKSNICANNGTCEDMVNGFKCTCPETYTGKRCETHIGNCHNVKCFNGGTCISTVDDYLCDCEDGFTGMKCEHDIDECFSNPCRDNCTCINGKGSFWCVCPSTFQTETFDSCTSSPCEHNSTCINKTGGYGCQCRPGSTGRRCEHNINDCLSSPCLNGGTCLDGLNKYTCQCPFGYDGDNCQLNNTQKICASYCHNSDSCAFNVESITCFCKPGFTGPTCQTEFNECMSNPCMEGVCKDKLAGFECECKRGWTGDRCDEVKDFCSSSPCQNSGTCLTIPKGPKCICDSDFHGEQCEHKVDHCQKVQCLNGGSCHVTGKTNHPWKCVCPQNFFGKYCQTEVKELAEDITYEQKQKSLCQDFTELPDELQVVIIATCSSVVIFVVVISSICADRVVKQVIEKRRSRYQHLYPRYLYSS